MKKNILIFPCGAEIALEAYNCLFQQKDLTLYGASSISDNGRFVFDNYIGGVPFVSDPNFKESITNIVKEYNIHYILPCMDIAILKLKELEDEIGCKVLSSDLKTVKIFSEKKLTYEYFKGLIRVPEIYDSLPLNNFPIFSKPNIGSSSRGVLKIDSEIDYKYIFNQNPNNLLVEYLPGDEYTVDCFTKKSGELIFVGARKRSRISNGISVETSHYSDPKVQEIAHIINDNIHINGSWFFQLKRDKFGELCLLEIADRFGGSSVLNRILGVNFAYLNILNEEGDVNIFQNSYHIEVGRSLDIKFKSTLSYGYVYIDYDDTIIINNLVNADAISFIYKCINANIPVILLTKHSGDLEESLKSFNISPNLFASIHQLNKNEKKSDFITHKNSIFIDDSFTERNEIFTTHNIPVISVENIKYI